MKDFIAREMGASRRALEASMADNAFLEALAAICNAAVATLKAGNKILFAGNGGSAADAQHLAAELVGRFAYDRPGLPAIALTTDTSILTAVGNDYGYEAIFARQVESLGVSGDLFVGLSTSGNSANVIKAVEACRARGIAAAAFTGAQGGELAGRCEYVLRAASDETPRIQEIHGLAGHILCAVVELELFPK